VLGTSLGEFFDDNDDEVYCFEEKDFYISHNEENKYSIKWIVPNAQKYEMEPIIIEIEPGGKSMEDDPHSGEEFGYVLEGEIVLQVGKKRYIIKQGNSFYYLANKFHAIYNKTNQKVTVLWVSTPPMF
jgi:quercetin dioxygenase-like cupin family protein